MLLAVLALASGSSRAASPAARALRTFIPALAVISLASFGLLLLLSSSSLAQSTPSTLIKNTGQAEGEVLGTESQVTMKFTTGSNSRGYRISTIAIKVTTQNNLRGPFAMSVLNLDTSGDPDPDDVAFNLTAPSSFSGGLTTFTAPADAILAHNTTYALSVISTNTRQVNYSITTSDDEDSGGSAGWSIDDETKIGGGFLLATPS